MKKLSIVAKVSFGVLLTLTLLILLFLSTQFNAVGADSPLLPQAVNEKFLSIDKAFYKRAVTPDMYKTSNENDDTDAVQDAFDSGLPVIFTRNYRVRSVIIGGVNQQIDFNGYWLEGITAFSDSVADKDCILQISGTYLALYNIKVDGKFNINYKNGVRWRTRPGYTAAQHDKVYGLEIKNTIVGMLFGSYLDDPSPLDAPQSENNIYSIKIYNVQKGMLLYQPNGFIKITGGSIQVGKDGWETSSNSAFYNAEDEICIYDKHTSLTIENCDIVKKTTTGYGFRGKYIFFNNCNIDVAGIWGLIEGDIHISDTKSGKQHAITANLFQIARNIEGQLIIDGTCIEGDSVSKAYLISGLTRAPAFYVTIKNSNFIGWAYDMIASIEDRGMISVEDTYFKVDDVYSLVDDRTSASGSDSTAYSATNLAINVDVTGEFMANTPDNKPKSGWTIYEVGGVHGACFNKGSSDLPSGYASYIEYRDETGDSYIFSNYFPVLEGDILLTKGWYKHNSASSDSRVLITWFNDSNVYIGSEILFMGQDIESDVWTEALKEVTVPSNAHQARIQICLGKGYLMSTGLGLYPKYANYNNSFINELNKALSAFPSSNTEESSGLIMTSPNGSRYKIFINEHGKYDTTLLSAVAPTISGSTNLSLQVGYDATSTAVYTITGTEPITVSKTGGDEKIVWNNTTKKLDIAEGLTAGNYEVVLTADNGTLPSATLLVTLIVKENLVNNITTSSNDSSKGTIIMTVENDGSVSVRIKPNDGFEIADVKVDGVSVGKVSSYIFEDMTEKHTIHADFAEVKKTAPDTPITGVDNKSKNIAGGCCLVMLLAVAVLIKARKARHIK